MAHGDVAALAFLESDGDPHQIGQHGILAGRLHVQGESSNLRQPGGQLIESGLSVNGAGFRLDPKAGSSLPLEHGQLGGAVAPRQAVEEALELQLAEESHHPGPVVVAHPTGIQIQGDGDIGDDGGQPFAQQGLLLVGSQGLPSPFAGDLVQVGDGLFDGVELLQERRGRLVPDAGHAGDVVRGVALEPLEVNELSGLHAVALADALFVVNDGVGEAAAGGEHLDVRPDKLEGVGVAGDDEGLHSLLAGLPGQGAQHVVGFVALHLEDGEVEGADDLLDAVHLDGHLLGGFDPVGFVGFILVVAETLAHVEGHGDVVGLLVPQDVEEHGGEAVDGIGQLPLGGGQFVWEGVEGAVGQGMAVNEDQFPFGHRSLPRGMMS